MSERQPASDGSDSNSSIVASEKPLPISRTAGIPRYVADPVEAVALHVIHPAQLDRPHQVRDQGGAIWPSPSSLTAIYASMASAAL